MAKNLQVYAFHLHIFPSSSFLKALTVSALATPSQRIQPRIANMSFGAPKNLRNNIPGIVYPKHSLRTDSSWYMGTLQSIEIQ